MVPCDWSKVWFPRGLAGPGFTKPLLKPVSVQDQRVTCPLAAQNWWEEGETWGSLQSHGICFSRFWKEGKKTKEAEKTRKNQEERSSRNQKFPEDIRAAGKSQLVHGPCVLLCPAAVRCPGRYLWRRYHSWISPPFPSVCWEWEQGSGCKTNWLGIAAELKMVPLHASQPLRNVDIVCLKMGFCGLVSKGGCCICFLFLWRNFPFPSQNPTPFVARITECMKHQSQILWTLGVIFTAGVDTL